MRILRPTLIALAAATAIAPAAAMAAPDHTGDVDASKPKFEWDSKLGSGFTTLSNLHDKVPCGTPGVHDCDLTLLHVTGCGTLGVVNTGAIPTAADTDLYTYYSDKDGNVVSAGPSSAQGTPTPNESVAVDLPDADNWVLIEIDYTDSIDPGGAVHGTATFTPNDPVENPDFCTPAEGGATA